MSNTMMLQAALNYISEGFPVFPCCWPDFTGKCGCGRNHQGRDVGKAPLTPKGLNDATLIQLRAKEYWGRWPYANIGIAIPDGYFYLDVDVDSGGYESLEQLQNAIGLLPETRQITTGSGGAHFPYKTDKPIRNTTALAGYKGLDIRGKGGYVIAPPSMHRCGKCYEVSPVWDGPITKAPDALIELCLKGHRTTSGNAPEIGSIIANHTRNQTLTSLAGSLRHRGLPYETIYLALSEVNLKQCQPPLPNDEVMTIAKSISRHEPGQPQTGFRGGVIL